MSLLREYIKGMLLEQAKLSPGQVKALQAVKDGQTSETHASKSLTFQKLIDMGFIEGEVSTGRSQTKIGGGSRGYAGWKEGVDRSVKNMKITSEGESALSVSLTKSTDKLTQAKIAIMQAIIDGGGTVSVKDLPTWKGWDRKTPPFLRGVYWKAWEELYYDDRAINWGENQKDMVPFTNFDKVKDELGL
jgi:hypothetical protein